MTNKEKFREIFGFNPRTDNCPDLNPKVCQQQKSCDDCTFQDWWSKPYKIRGEEYDDGK